MRTSVIPIALFAMCIFTSPATCLEQQPIASQSSGNENDQLCTIAGTVLSANTGEPLKKAHVVLHPQSDGSNDHPLTATTDASGHFSIEKIPAGGYGLRVDRANYLDTQYGQDQPDKPGATLSLAPGQKMTDLLFRLHRAAVITGRVLDEDGDPVLDVFVTAVAHTTVRGKFKFRQRASEKTNDLGEYRIYGLEPGRYLLLASPPRVFPWRNPDEQAAYLPTYYPGATEIARASTIEVKSGDEITGIDLVFVPKLLTRTYKIHGHVVNSLSENPDAQFVVLLAPRGKRDLDFISSDKQGTVDSKTEDFEIKDVVPGEYVVAVISFGTGANHKAAQIVNVIASDVDGVVLVLTRGIDIPIQVTLEGKAAASANVTVGLNPSADEATANFMAVQRSVARPDGSYVLKEVGDGSYWLNAYSNCQECYLKSASANGVDLLERGVQVSSGEAPSPIALVYSSNSGTLTGAVTNKDDLPAPGALVVLVPDSSSHQKPDQYKSSTTDQYGHFEIRGVPPGHYKAFAWEKADEESYGDPDLLRRFESMAESFDIAGNEQKSVLLKMIAAADSANQLLQRRR
jgi:5-hydroxyisourate hydrolase-like protein (transthyretin family)